MNLQIAPAEPARGGAPSILPPGVSRPLAAAALLVIIAGLLLGVADIRAAWMLRPDGSSLTTGKMPVFDFMNLWAGGKLALAGRLDILFEQSAYLAWLRSTLSPDIGGSEWSYPPTMLLFGAPLSLLPLNGAYVVWTVLTLSAFAWAMYGMGLRGLPLIVAALSPAALANITFGQNGAFTAALLAGGLLLAQRRPWISGILFGFLTTKPHLGILVPFCLLANGNWRAIASSVITALALAAGSAFWFGLQAWSLFFARTQPMMQAIMEAPWPQGYQANSVTLFMVARYFGAGVNGAYAVQFVAICVCIAAAWRIWRRPTMELAEKTALTLMLAMVATPYGYSYDMVGFAGALAVLAVRRGAPAFALAVAMWLWPLLQKIFVAHGLLGPVGGVFVAVAVIAAYFIVQRDVKPAPQVAV